MVALQLTGLMVARQAQSLDESFKINQSRLDGRKMPSKHRKHREIERWTWAAEHALLRLKNETFNQNGLPRRGNGGAATDRA
ncbi:hypothetical protein [Nitrospirillum amazonense]|uniref:hypothetical protein n=1 Tax=Nitrospirillum amazonense TaxID=28077 RepID=UPI00119DAD1A|nr:hypothetical protein [Nitrospirillum amazonense]